VGWLDGGFPLLIFKGDELGINREREREGIDGETEPAGVVDVQLKKGLGDEESYRWAGLKSLREECNARF